MVRLYDTTLRDGSQREGISYSAEDKLLIALRLDELGIDYIEGGWPGSNPKDVEFFERAKEVQFCHAKLSAFGSTRKAGVKAEEDSNLLSIVASGAPVAAIFGKAWDFHVKEALKTTLEENLAMISDSIRFLKGRGLEVFFDAEHFFDGYKQNPEYALQALQAAAQAGADTLVLCDTNGGTLPQEISQIVAEVKEALDTPLGIHAHNDSEMAVANSVLAVLAGCTQVQGTINGYGERCGNANLCSIIPALQLKMGIQILSGESLERLVEISRLVSETANLSPNDHQPYVGKAAFAHKGGIHVSALMRHPETYEHLVPELVGNRRRVLVSELSGAANVLYKAQEYQIPMAKGSPAVRTVLDAVKDLEYQGYHFEGAEGSFELMMKRSLGLLPPLFQLIGFRMIIEKREENGPPVSEATVKVKVKGEVVHTVAEGDGPVNALDQALRSALVRAYPMIDQFHLSDYKVRVLDGKDGTAAKVRVLIQTRDEDASWGTVGVSTNIIEASWRALIDAMEYGIRRRGLAGEESQ